MQSIWSGNLAFGTILIPVRMYGASSDLRVPFHEVHAEDSGRVRHRKFCEACGSQLHASDIRKGYEVAGQMITFTDEEIDALRPAASRSMRIVGFCAADEVPLIALDRPFYLGTEHVKKGGAGQPFALLREALSRSGKAAIVSWTSRASEQIGMLVPYDKGFLVKSLLYAGQLRPFEQVEVDVEPADPELVEMGMRLIERQTFRFRHEEYKETYSRAVKDVIEARALGREVKIEPAAQQAETRSLKAELERLLA
jgi:DNA end-binding protein Ku